MEKLLYESQGTPQKRKKGIGAMGVVEIVCGGFLLLVAFSDVLRSDDVNTFLYIAGFAAVALGVFVCSNSSKSDYTDKYCLRLYEDHIEGTTTSPYEEFSVTYDEVEDVKKQVLLSNPMLYIQTSKKIYVVLVDDLDEAFRIIDQKLADLERI